MQAIDVLTRHQLFHGVAASALERLAEGVRARLYSSGEIILRAGAAASELYFLAQGAARVELAGGRRRVLLVPPQCFGEMSALTGDLASATVVAQGPVQVWTLPSEALFDALGADSVFFRNLAELLAQRLRDRTRQRRGDRPRVALMRVVGDTDRAVLQAIATGLRHYATESILVHDGLEATEQVAARVQAWRDEAPDGAVLLIGANAQDFETLQGALTADDLLVLPEFDERTPLRTGATLITWRDIAQALRRRPSERWSHPIHFDHAREAATARAWERSRFPALDHLVRRIAGKEVGIAMSVGAAAGLAHLGMLQVLEEDGLPVDFVCGSSMGGAVALAYAHFGSARKATEAIERFAGEFARSKGLQWLPRASLVAESRIRAITAALYGSTTFAQLQRPAAVVAADLAAGKRVVLDAGGVADAARATTAIPGLFTPVRMGDAILVDGGVVTRVPADLLSTRECGLKLAAIVRPRENAALDPTHAANDLERRLQRPLGLCTALGSSWRLLGWWDSESQTQRADLTLSIPTPAADGFNFEAAKALIECGRQCSAMRLPQIRSAVQDLFRSTPR